MKLQKIIPALLLSALVLSACAKPAKKVVKFSDDSDPKAAFPTLVDTAAKEAINISKDYKFNQSAVIVYKSSVGATGVVEYKAKKITEITKAGDLTPGEGKKLVLLEFSYKGSDKNKGKPSVINEIGDTPAPQFVMLNRANNTSEVEATEYSDAYAQSKKLFELYKLTLDNNKVVDTALVFEIDKSQSPDLAIRFTNKDGKIEFYAIK